jgi:hypothetical protein
VAVEPGLHELGSTVATRDLVRKQGASRRADGKRSIIDRA